MRLDDNLRFGTRSLTTHRARAWLTLLAMALGTAAVILLSALGEGAALYVWVNSPSSARTCDRAARAQRDHRRPTAAARRDPAGPDPGRRARHRPLAPGKTLRAHRGGLGPGLVRQFVKGGDHPRLHQ